MSQEETPNSISFRPLTLLKLDVSQGGIVMEFTDGNGTTLKTPRVPYPENFDPMKVRNASYNQDEIIIKNDDGDIIFNVFADEINYESPVRMELDPNGYPCILPEAGEENLPLRTFSVDHARASQVGYQSEISRALAESNHARQELDEAVQMELNERFPDQARPVMRASELMRQRQQAGFPFPANDQCSATPTPNIEIDFDMKCSCCSGKIHYPEKIIQLLGEKQTIKYFDFCKKTGTEPQLFCCSCFGLMKNNSNIISAINKMNQKIKKMMDLTEREEELEKREKELDEQIKKAKK